VKQGRGNAFESWAGSGALAAPTASGVLGTNVSTNETLLAAAGITPQLGLHYVQALENSASGSGTTFYGGSTMQLKAALQM